MTQTTIDTAALKRRAVEIIDSMAPRLIEIADDIHAHPEIRFEERYAAKLLSDELEKAGLAVERGTAGMETAFRGDYGSGRPGPTIALLGEYDALPEIGHACGHNLMGTMSVGAAIAIKTLMADAASQPADSSLALPGKVVMLGTPAEEGGAGKVIMVEKGIFNGIDAAMIIHPGSNNRVHASSIASYKLVIRFHGKPAHAAASPHEGINALDALIMTFNGINALRQHVTPDVRIHGIITKGGAAPNIIPDFAEGNFVIRAADKNMNEKNVEKVKNIARGAALATGATVEFERTGIPYDPMKSNVVLEKVFTANLVAQGVAEEMEERKGGGAGSTDMGNVSCVVPAIHPHIAIAPKGTPGHTHEMCAAAGSEGGHRGLIIGAKVLATTTIDLLTNPSLVEAAWKELRGQ